MPTLEVDEKNRVLVHIPSGKSSIADPDSYVDQNPQKGPTCWYNVFHHLRPRYGAAVDALVHDVHHLKELEELKQNEDFKALEKGRRIEKTISKYRKQVNELSLIPQPTKKEEQKKQEDEIRNATLELAKKLIGDLGGREGTKRMNAAMKRLRITHGAIHRLFIAEVTDAYQLLISDWRPQSQFDGLMKALREQGALYVGGRFGNLNYFSSSCKFTTQRLDNRAIFSWSVADEKAVIADSNGHAILIVGAERLENGEEYIYFLDPNDRSFASGRGDHMYRISYASLIAGLHVIDLSAVELGCIEAYLQRSNLSDEKKVILQKHKNSLEQKIPLAPCAYQANEKHTEAVKQQYQRVIEQVQRLQKNQTAEKKLTASSKSLEEKMTLKKEISSKLLAILHNTEYWSSKTSYQFLLGGKNLNNSRVPTSIAKMATSPNDLDKFIEIAEDAMKPSFFGKFFCCRTESVSTGRDVATHEFYKLLIQIKDILNDEKATRPKEKIKKEIKAWKDKYYSMLPAQFQFRRTMVG
jgi:hypothetical protein